MTDQQKKAVEESVKKYKEELESSYLLRMISTSGFDLCYEDGLNEVLNNPEKYGLITHKRITISDLKDYDKDFLIQVIFKERGELQDRKEKDLEFLIEMQDRLSKAHERRDVTRFEYVDEMIADWIDELKGDDSCKL